MSNAFNSINDFVSAFLTDTSVDPDVFDEWKERENSFKELINKFIPKVKKTKKNKNAPKNPRSAYILFSNVERENVKNENPKMTPKEIMKELGKKWKEADEDEKEKYRELAKEDKERFDEEMKNYVPVEEEDTGDKKKRKKKAKNSPKNASGPYIFFCKEEREKIKKELPDLKSQEILKELGQRWKLIKDTDKVKKYQEMAEVDKERFKEEMKNYVPSEDNEPKQKKQRAKKDKNAPKNPTTMYQLFCKDNRENLKKEGLNPKEVTKKLSEMWKDFNKEDKKNKKKVEKWNSVIEKDKKRFEKEMEEYKLKKEQESEESDSDDSHIMDDKEEEEEEEDESVDNIVKSIIENHGDSVTKKVIKEELKKKGIELSKDELNSVIQRVNV